MKLLSDMKLDGVEAKISANDIVLVESNANELFAVKAVSTDSTETTYYDDWSDVVTYLGTLDYTTLSSLKISSGEDIKVSDFTTSLDTLFAGVQIDITDEIESTVDLSDLDVSGVTNMNHMFNGFLSLVKLDLSSLDTSSVTDMGGMFCSCISLTELDLSSFDTSNVMVMSTMFCECSSLVTLDMSNFDFSSISSQTSSESMFDECTVLETVYVKDETAKEFIDARLSDAGLTITSTIKGVTT